MSTKRIGIFEISLWILAVLLILVTITPFALGFKVKSDYARLIDEFSQVYQVDLQIVNYQQGYFGSDAVLEIVLPEFQQSITLKERIVHGPLYLGLINQGRSPLVAAVVTGQIEASVDASEDLKQFLSGENSLVYQNIIDFKGDVDSQAYFPNLNQVINNESGTTRVKTTGLILNQQYVSSSRMIKGEAQLPEFSLQSDLSTVTIENINISYSLSIGSNQLMIGDSVASIGLIDVISADSQFAMKSLTVRSVASENTELINSGVQISLRELLASNQKFGPISLNISVNGLNASSLQEIQTLQNDASSKLSQGLPQEQVNAMMMGQLMTLIPDLIKQAEVKVNPLSINSELGKLESDLDFRLEGIDANTPADPMFLFGSMILSLNFSIDDALLKQFVSWQLQNQHQQLVDLQAVSEPLTQQQLDKQVKENIQAMLDENWLILEEGVFVSKIRMQQGELLINDTATDPIQKIMSSMGASAAIQ